MLFAWEVGLVLVGFEYLNIRILEYLPYLCLSTTQAVHSSVLIGLNRNLTHFRPPLGYIFFELRTFSLSKACNCWTFQVYFAGLSRILRW